MTPAITHTDEQREIISSVADADGGNLLIEAGAGCAKTTTLAAASRRLRVPTLALAFNRSIADEMSKKMGGSVSVKTFNGLGHGAWALHIGYDTKLQLEPRKVARIVSALKPPGGKEGWGVVVSAIRIAQMRGIVPDGEGLVPDSEEEWKDIAVEAGADLAEAAGYAEYARAGLKTDIEQARGGLISYDDQVYCPTLLGAKFPKYPGLIVDEDQDLSPLNHEMMKKVAPRRIIACGDRAQAIYGFRGAHGQSAEVIRGMAEGWKDLPLMTTFRCPKAVVARQLHHVPDFRAWDGAGEGYVLALDGSAGASPGGWTIQDLRLAFGSKSSVVLCRNNAPLLRFAFRCIKSSVGVQMMGRDIGKGLVALSRKITPEDSMPISVHIGAVDEWEQREIAGAESVGKDAEGARDRAESLRAVAESGLTPTAGDLRKALELLFERQDGILLSSIHKFKGLEREVVLLLDPWRVPSKKDREAGGEQLRQAKNLRYVAETRAKEGLLFASLSELVG